MNPNWAEENLQTIRTLMERSAIYRRALGPIMLFAGALGVIAANAGLFFDLNSPRAFGALWLGTAVIVVAGAFLIARRQAIKDKDNFWSPPTRRVAQALLPPLLAGMFLTIPLVIGDSNGLTSLATMIWIMFYGCALHAAGFFMPRGIKYLGWLFIAGSCAMFYALFKILILNDPNAPWLINFFFDNNSGAHWIMGFFFGVLHLAYGAYLFLTEKKNPVA
jgi:hypothetical protein